MKAKTKFHNGSNYCYVYFCYEDYSCGQFRSYDRAQEYGNGVYLVGNLYNPFYGCTEPIDELHLHNRPTITTIKEFINHCKQLVKAI